MNLHRLLSLLVRASLLGAMLGMLAVLGGCAAPAKAPQQRQAVFYPPAPDLPRIQHLATFATVKDLGPQPKSPLKDFLLGAEKEAEALVRPYGVAMTDGKIYVADTRGPGLALFDLKGKVFSLVNGTGTGRMQRPINIAIDKDGTKYVTDIGRNQVLVYDRTDRFVAAYGGKDDFKPVGISIADDLLYLVDIERHEVQVLDKRSGRLKRRLGKADLDKDQALHLPTNLAIGPEGDLYVVETGNFRVARFKPDGKLVRHYGEPGQSSGQFARPKGIAVDRAGRLYVGDAAFQNVQIFANSGQVLMAFGQPSDGSGGLNLPVGIAIDYDNVDLFRGLADPRFDVEHLILVVSQFGPNQVDVFGFGKMRDVVYPTDKSREPAPAK